MDLTTNVRADNGIAFLVSASIVYGITAASCSSPQTTEINAKSRADTLMKWVHIGQAQGLVFVIVAAVFDRKHAPAILSGGFLAIISMYIQYYHARNRGLKSDLPGTEDSDKASVIPGAAENAFTRIASGVPRY